MMLAEVARGMQTTLDALAATWKKWASLGLELTGADWGLSTRCVPWTVRDVYAHHSGFPVAFTAPAPPPPASDDVQVSDAVAVLRGFNADRDQAEQLASGVADHAVAEAAQHATRDLVGRFIDVAPAAIAALREANPNTLLPWGPFVVPLAEGVRIVLLEATVHLLDVQRALAREPDVPPAALRQTAALLAEVARPVEFIEAATGRAPTGSALPVMR